MKAVLILKHATAKLTDANLHESEMVTMHAVQEVQIAEQTPIGMNYPDRTTTFFPNEGTTEFTYQEKEKEAKLTGES